MEKRGRLLNIMAERCRICLINSGFMVKLRDQLVESKLEDLTKCTCIDIKYKKDLPDAVCHICFYKLSMWAEFKELFIQSHQILLKQLHKISEVPDDAVSNSEIVNRHLKRSIKQTHFSESDGSYTSLIDKKKSKTDFSLTKDTNVNTDEVMTDTIAISDTEGESTSSKDSTWKACDINGKQLNKNVENDNDGHTESDSSLKLEQSKLSPTRCKSKQRLTRLRNARLTPAQKTGTITKKDKLIKKQKRIEYVLKQLKTDLTEKYIGFHNIHGSRSRLRNQNQSSPIVSPNQKNNMKKRRTKCYSEEKEASLSSLMKNDGTTIEVEKSRSQTNVNMFTPKLSQNELVIGKTTFIIRSNLILQDEQYNQALNSSKKNSESLNGDINGNGEQKNTDIIDAVELRRVPPKIFDANNSNDVKRCLDIRIESREFQTLTHIQTEVADFIENEMKHELFNASKSIAKTSVDTNASSTLNQNLKTLIQNAIEKNIEQYTDMTDAGHQEFRRISSELVKAAVNLPEYQPKVVIERLNLASKHNINDALKRAGLKNKFKRKRRIIKPKKYRDFNTSFNSDFSDVEEEKVIEETPRATRPRMFKNSTIKQFRNKINKGTEPNDSAVTIEKRDDAKTLPLFIKEDLMNGQKSGKNGIQIKDLTNAEFYMCGICKCTFNNQNDVQTHVRTSHTTPSQNFLPPVNNNTVVLQQQKQKKLRCKKCHEIVDYQSVKAHVSMCKMMHVYVCHICDSDFPAKELLMQHLETHDDPTDTIDTMEMDDFSSPENREEAVASTMSQESQTVGLQMLPTVSEALQKGYAIQTNKEGIRVMPLKNHTNETNVQSTATDESNVRSDEVTVADAKSDVAKNVEKMKEYTCFLCDKIFTDEEILKDHLQQHCDDLSDGEQSDRHKCTICGNILDSDRALEEHICKHWFDGEDNNNLNNVNSNDEKCVEDENKDVEDSSSEEEVYQCSECWEMFDSQTLLSLHTKIHIQNVAKPQEENYQYLCMLCDDLLDSEQDLADHVKLHNENAQVCQICDKPFRTLAELQEHVIIHL